MSKQELLNSLYGIDNLITVSITIPAADWQSLMHAEPHGGRCNFSFVGDRFDWYKATSVTISGSKFPLGTSTFADVGIIKKSYCGSFSTVKPSLRLDFSKNIPSNEDLAESIFGTKLLVLNNSIQDPSYVRQTLGYELFHQAGLPYARCNYAKVLVNGTNMGIYVNLEPYKKSFLKNQFLGNEKGNLYELEVGEDLDPAIVASGKISFESGITDNAKDLAIAAAQIAENGLVGVKRIVDYPAFVKLFAMETLLKHWDGFTANTNNTYIYNDVVAVKEPTMNNVKFKFIPCGLDQILQEGRNFEVGARAIMARLIRDDEVGKKELFEGIRNLANGIFGKANWENVLKPYIARVESLLASAGVAPTGEINTVRNQIKLIRSGAFQLIGEFPSEPTLFLNRSVNNCFHASNSEFIPPGSPSTNPQEVYHYAPTSVPSDSWTVIPSSSAPNTIKLRNLAYSTFLRGDSTIKTPSGKLNIYASRTDPDSASNDEGNKFVVEPSGGFAGEKWIKTGYFRLKSKATGGWVAFSESDFTPGGKKEVCQVGEKEGAAVLWLG
ncbi:hypothetical protein VTL71DRAFT_4548 [Oculimacula yallundae]|uniref:Cellulosomal protein n=1 Tax=Oculimacula yallundae TaxID=86028 RepID=A0ABR4C3Z2_9HELO